RRHVPFPDLLHLDGRDEIRAERGVAVDRVHVENDAREREVGVLELLLERSAEAGAGVGIARSEPEQRGQPGEGCGGDYHDLPADWMLRSLRGPDVALSSRSVRACWKDTALRRIIPGMRSECGFRTQDRSALFVSRRHSGALIGSDPTTAYYEPSGIVGSS